MPVPADFVRHTRTSPLTAPWEPIFAKREIEQMRLGLQIRAEHANSRGFLHGGLIAALADNAMGLSFGVHLEAHDCKPDRGLVTTSLSIDFVGRAALGQWLEVDTRFVHPGKRHGVARAFVTADGEIIARANAAFAIS